MRTSNALGLAVLLLALGLPSAFAEGHKIGVLLKGRTKFWNAVEQGSLAAKEKFGVEVIVKAPPTESDIAAQILMLNSLAEAGVEAIVIAPGHKTTLAEPVAALAAKGIKIVVIDTPLDGNVGAVFVGTNHRVAGEAAGRLLASFISAGDAVSVLRHAQNNGATGAREEGAIQVLGEIYPKIKVHGDIYAGSESVTQSERANLLLDKYPDAKGLLASGTPGTMAIVKALTDRHANGGIKFVGFGFNLNEEVVAAFESGVLHGWIAQQPREIGYTGVMAAFDLLGGKTVPSVIYIDVHVVTKRNLYDPQTQALLKL